MFTYKIYVVEILKKNKESATLSIRYMRTTKEKCYTNSIDCL